MGTVHQIDDLGKKPDEIITAKLFAFLEQFLPLTSEEKQAILALDVFKSVKKGTLLLQPGSMSTESFFVLQGCMRTYLVLDGDEKTTGFYTELEAFSPTTLATGKPNNQYLVCLEDCLLLIATPELADETNKRFPRFETLCKLLSEKLLADKQEDLDEFKFSTAEQRYLRLLETRPKLVQRVPQHMLASYLGMKPESLSRIRRRLAKSHAA